MTFSGKTKTAGVIGHPIGHSRSPLLHGAWLKAYDIDGVFVPFDVAPENLQEALKGLSVLGIKGVSITIPHKESALTLMDHVDRSSKIIGAVNMVTVNEKGDLIGTNTDHFGFIENLRQNINWSGRDKTAVVIGAGGAARAVVYGLAEAGVKSIKIINRTQSKAQNIADSFSPHLSTSIDVLPWEDRSKALIDIDFLVNTTSLGMTGQPALDLDLSLLPKKAVVTDIVYIPLMTKLLQEAKARGNQVVDGLGMLIHQGRPAFKSWFGINPEATDDIKGLLLNDIKRAAP